MKPEAVTGAITAISWGTTGAGHFVIRALTATGSVLCRVDIPERTQNGFRWHAGEWAETAEQVKSPPEVWIARERRLRRAAVDTVGYQPRFVAAAILEARDNLKEFCHAARRRSERRFSKRSERTASDIQTLLSYFCRDGVDEGVSEG